MKFKVGQLVKVKKFDSVEEYMRAARGFSNAGFNKYMLEYGGKTLKISKISVSDCFYNLENAKSPSWGYWCWCEQWLELPEKVKIKIQDLI
jgi:hypothetical protein